MRTYKAGLPYADNARTLGGTLAINLGVVVLLHRSGISFRDILWDSFWCALITTAVDMAIVHRRMKRMRAAGELPSQVPESAFMQRLPQHPLLLGTIYAAGFGALAVGLNAGILCFFGLGRLEFAPWLAYKLIYATALSVKITEFCIFRYVQPDWANAGQTGGGAKKPNLSASVRNPLPRIGLFKAMYGSVTGNIATNIVIGSLLGGVRVVEGQSVVIAPTTAEGIPITGLVFGLLLGILATKGVLDAMDAAILARDKAIPETAAPDRRFAWMPVGRGALTGLLCACAMTFSAAALPAIMKLFGLSVLDFYQFCVLITIYAALVGKPISYVLIRRCAQPDYIRHVLKRARA